METAEKSRINVLRYSIGRLRTVRADDGWLGLPEWIGQDLIVLAIIAEETGNSAMMATVRWLARLCFFLTGETGLGNPVLDGLADEGADAEAVFCSECGEMWTPDDQWPPYVGFEIPGLGHEPFAACSSACAQSLIEGHLPGFTSFPTVAAWERFMQSHRGAAEPARRVANLPPMAS